MPIDGVYMAHAGRTFELDQLCPDLRGLLQRLGAFCRASGYAAPVITSAIRTADDQRRLYRERIAAGRCPPFSWHLVNCAADLRTSHWTPLEAASVEKWLRTECVGPRWELVTEDHGTGPHYHVAHRDGEARAQWIRANIDSGIA